MVAFISSSAASSSTCASVSGASSLVQLLMRCPQLSPQPSKAGLGAELIASFLAHFRSAPLHNALNKHCKSTSRRVDKFPFREFVSVVRRAPPELRALPVTAIESYQKGGENATLVPHRYALVTIQQPHGGSTYLKLHLRAVDLKSDSIPFAELANERAALVRPHDRRLAALELAPTPRKKSEYEYEHAAGGPSLDALAELLDIIHKRAGRYELCGRNCFWLADLVLFSCAAKFREAWLARESESESESGARVWPDSPMRRFLHGEIDVFAASAQCFLPEGTPGWVGVACGALVRVFGTFDMRREVEEVVGKWRQYVDAAPIL